MKIPEVTKTLETPAQELRRGTHSLAAMKSLRSSEQEGWGAFTGKEGNFQKETSHVERNIREV